jgi:general stress protein 26
MTASNQTDRDAAEHVWALITRCPVCMMATRDDGVIRARPMTPTYDPPDNAIYFLTDERRHKDDEIAVDPNVCLVFQNEQDDDYASISGTAEVIDDRARIAELWSLFHKARWNGPTDPNIRLVKVTPNSAEFWNGGNLLITSIKMLAATISGKPRDVAYNKKVQM